eukprot:m.69915 g.69915  ORF g.69915 m.69915 type:complete len:135 (+) comp16048_c0_seq11:1805-2209(+)
MPRQCEGNLYHHFTRLSGIYCWRRANCADDREWYRMVPVVERAQWYGRLYDPFPVLVLDSFNITHQNFKTRALAYLNSDAFRSSDFARGWERLFMGFWRRRVLEAAGRPVTARAPPGQPTDAYFEMYDYSVGHG